MQIHPFFAIRAVASRVFEVSCPPYDVVDHAEAAAFAIKPNNFMRVVRPEVDFSPQQDPHSPEVYQRGLENLQGLIARKLLIREDRKSFYVYRQSSPGRKQAGLVCCVNVADYLRGDIRRHELTRPDKEVDRTDHMLALGAHCEPVLLTVMDQHELPRQLARDMNHRPLFHFAAKDGVTHTFWAVDDIEPYITIFDKVSCVFIADGHHRSAAAARVAEKMRAIFSDEATEESQRFPAVIYPAEELVILPYHRLARLPDGQSTQDVQHQLAAVGSLEPIAEGVDPAPTTRGEVGIFLAGNWWRFRLPSVTTDSALDRLDVVRLSVTVLAPIFGIADERTNPRVSFLGGCSTDALAGAVRAGRGDIAFAMHPTSIAELLEVAQANLIMPPKSTWFDPKIRSGLFVHSFSSTGDVELPSNL